MKSLQVLPALNVGGVERGVVDFARVAKRYGHEMVVISSGGELVKELHKVGVRHYELPVHKKTLWSLRLVSEVAKIIEAEGIDIVHARSRVPGWIAWLAARKTGTPFVTTCHGYYSNHALSRVMGWGKQVITISRIIGRHMIDDFGVSPERIRLVHRGVDLSQFRFREIQSTFSARPFRIINVGRFSPIKGQAEFLHAIHKLKAKFGQIEVWLVGSESKKKQKYTQELKALVSQLGLESCVKFLGTRRDVPDLLKQSDLLVLSTLVPEAFGRVAIEAGAVGTPVVATKVGGVLDIIDDGKNGLLVPPGNTEAMAEAMFELLMNRAKASDFAKNLRQKVEKNFTLEMMAEKTLSVYADAKKRKKILMIKLGAMGDVILAVPSMRMLRKRFPNAHLTLLVDRALAPMVSSLPYLDEIIPVKRKKLSKLFYLLRLAKRIRREGFEFSVDFQNTKWTYLIAFLGGIPKRHGFARGKLGFLLNHGNRDFNAREKPVKHQFRILSQLGVRDFDERLELRPIESTRRKIEEKIDQYFGVRPKRIVAIVPGSSPKWKTKRWPLENFEDLANRLIAEQDSGILLLGSSEDAQYVKQFNLANPKRVLNLLGKTSLQELVAAVHAADVVVSGDTAPLHIAGAFKKQTIAIFGPTDPKRHMQVFENAKIFNKHLACQPCYQGVCHNAEKLACLKQISVHEVYQAMTKKVEVSVPL